MVQRGGLFGNDGFAADPSWESVTELKPDAMSRVDTIETDDEVVFYNYRVVAFADIGGPAVGWSGVCRLDQDKREVNLAA